MKGPLLTIDSLAAFSSLAIGLNSALAATQPPHASAKVAVANSALMRILVDGRGRTLCLFQKDRHGKSAPAARSKRTTLTSSTGAPTTGGSYGY